MDLQSGTSVDSEDRTGGGTSLEPVQQVWLPPGLAGGATCPSDSITVVHGAVTTAAFPRQQPVLPLQRQVWVDSK